MLERAGKVISKLEDGDGLKTGDADSEIVDE